MKTTIVDFAGIGDFLEHYFTHGWPRAERLCLPRLSYREQTLMLSLVCRSLEWRMPVEIGEIDYFLAIQVEDGLGVMVDKNYPQDESGSIIGFLRRLGMPKDEAMAATSEHYRMIWTYFVGNRERLRSQRR